MFLRNLFFEIKIFKINKIEIPVVSVGNITTGGTGKTPVVEYLVNYFLNKNVRVAVISRGYKRNTKGSLIVSDGKIVYSSPEKTGDEPYQIAKKFDKAIVIVDENRYRGAKLAQEKFNAQVIILDDGFQHRKIYRDLDIVLIDITKPPQNDYMLPVGLRREPVSSLKRADILLFTRWNENASIDTFQLSNIIVGKVRFEPTQVVKIDKSAVKETSEIAGKVCSAFCGIGNPKSFENVLKILGCKINKFRIFSDHYQYNKNDLELIIKDFDDGAAEIIITTEKDSVRLTNYLNELYRLPVYYVEISACFVEGEDILIKKLNCLEFN